LAGSGASALAREAPVAEPFGYTEAQQQTAEWDAHKGNDECEPTAVGVGSGTCKPAENRLKKQGGQYPGADNGTTPLQQLPRAVVGFDS